MSEVKRILRLAAPVIVQFVLDKSVQVTAIVLVGHLGADQLAATSLGASLANVTGNSFLMAFASGLSTLCGQAYGAGNYEAVGHWCQRAMVILALVCLLISAVWLSAGKLLLALGQEADIAHMTAVYMRLLIPGLLACAVNYSLTFYLQAQGLMRPGAIASMLMAVCAVPLNWVLIHTLGMGYLGAALATSLLYLVRTAVLLGYMQYTGVHRQTWSGWSSECLRKWVPFLYLGLPSMLLVSEWWASEVAVLSAGYLAQPQLSLSAMAIYQNSNALAFMLPAGMAVACSTRVANELGAGDGAAAAHAARVGVGLIACLVSLLASLLCVFRKPWSKLFSNDEALQAAVQGALKVLAGYIVLDSLQCTIAGTIRGCGRQMAAAPIVLVSYWLVGLPVAFLLGFTAHMGVPGLCLGMLIGTAVHLVLVSWLWLRTDWQREVSKAAERAEVHTKIPVYQRLKPAEGNAAVMPPMLDTSADAEQLGLLSEERYSRVPVQELELELQLEPPLPRVASGL